MCIVFVSDHELNQIIEYIKQTDKQKRYVPRFQHYENGFASYLLGFVGEAVVNKWHGISVEQYLKFKKHKPDGGFDITIHCTKYDIKTLGHPMPNYQSITIYNKVVCFGYILVNKIDQNHYKIVGWIPETELYLKGSFQEKNSSLTGAYRVKESCWYIDENFLHPISELKPKSFNEIFKLNNI